MSKEIVKQGPLAVPEYIKREEHARGAEAIGREDVRLARVALAQAGSPQLVETNEKFLPGLKPGDMFNSVTGENFGRGPIPVVIVRVEPKRYMELKPFDEGGGIVDRNVKAGDPRTVWGPNGERPVATLYREYAAFLADRKEPIGLSFKGKSLAAAVDINTVIAMRAGVPAFGTVFNLFSAPAQKDKFNFQVFKAQPTGNVTEEQYRFAEKYYEQISAKELVVDAETTEVSEEDVPF